MTTHQVETHEGIRKYLPILEWTANYQGAWLADLNPEAYKVIQKSPLAAKLGPHRLYLNLEQALEAYQRQEPA